jgi:hypothetical protein
MSRINSLLWKDQEKGHHYLEIVNTQEELEEIEDEEIAGQTLRIKLDQIH